jgi:hypothetical protein
VHWHVNEEAWRFLLASPFADRLQRIVTRYRSLEALRRIAPGDPRIAEGSGI